MTAWLPGYFTGRLHAVTEHADRMEFYGVPIAWSVCGRAAVLDSGHADGRRVRCARCVRRTGHSWASAGEDGYLDLLDANRLRG